MDKNEGKNPIKARRSLFNNFLAKRSTKVEPHPFDDEHNVSGQSYRPFTGHLEAQSISANSTPIKACKDKNQSWRRHNSTQHMNSIDAIASFTNHDASVASASAKCQNNRLSHPFSLCCNNSDTNSVTHTVNAVNGRVHAISDVDDETEVDESGQLISTQVDIHSPIRTPSPVDSLSPPKCLPEVTKICDSSPEHEISLHNDSPTSIAPVFSEYQAKSIAMSACRSRFRDKLLPPGTCAPSSAPEQHLSSPNITADRISDVRPVPSQSSNRSYSQGILPKSGSEKPGSADSLVKQSLMAAQVLHLIPTEKARERYLEGVECCLKHAYSICFLLHICRSYLANNLAVNPLLGPAELDRVLPTREIKVFVGTWNMNGQHPPKYEFYINDFIRQLFKKFFFHFNYRQMNDFVLPTGIEHVPDLVVIGTQESCPERFEWEVILQETLGPSHVLFHSTALGTLHLCAFIRRDLIWYCSMPEDASFSVRAATAFRTKGMY